MSKPADELREIVDNFSDAAYTRAQIMTPGERHDAALQVMMDLRSRLLDLLRAGLRCRNDLLSTGINLSAVNEYDAARRACKGD